MTKKEARNDPRENFVRFEDDNDEEEQHSNNEYELRKITLLMSVAKNPVDIIWGNMGGNRGIYFIRRYLWNILGLFLIIFVSTPVVIFKTLQSISEKHLDLQFITSIPYIEYVSSQLTKFSSLTISPNGSLELKETIPQRSDSFSMFFLPPKFTVNFFDQSS